jgi:hypothetical protein
VVGLPKLWGSDANAPTQEIPFSKSDLLDRIRRDTENVDQLSASHSVDSSTESPSEDSSSDASGEWEWDRDQSVAKAIECFGPPKSRREDQELDLKDLRRHFAVQWPVDRELGQRRISRCIDPNTDTPPKEGTEDCHDRLEKTQHHRSTALDILEGKQEPTPSYDYHWSLEARFRFYAREEDAYKRALRGLDLKQGDHITDEAYQSIYQDMRTFFVREQGTLAMRQAEVDKRTKKARAQDRAAAARQNALRGWACLEEAILRSLRDYRRHLILVTEKEVEAWLLLIEKNSPSVIESAVLLNDFTPQQMLHIYQVIEDRGFRDLIWVADRHCWPRDIQDDPLMQVLVYPEMDYDRMVIR